MDQYIYWGDEPYTVMLDLLNSILDSFEEAYHEADAWDYCLLQNVKELRLKNIKQIQKEFAEYKEGRLKFAIDNLCTGFHAAFPASENPFDEISKDSLDKLSQQLEVMRENIRKSKIS